MSHQTSEDAGRAAGATEQSWLKALPTGTGITVLAFHLSPPVPATAIIESALHELQHSNPILRVRLNSSSSSAITVSKDAYVRLETLGAAATSDILTAAADGKGDEDFDSSSPLRTLLQRELNRNPWAGKNPDSAVIFATLYDLPAIEHAVLAVRVHTLAADRTAALAITRELLGLMNRASSLSAVSEGVVAPLLPGVEDLIPPEHRKKAFWARGKDMLGYSLNFTRSSMLTFDDTKSPRSTDVLEMELNLDETRKVVDSCQKRGVKLSSALTAAALIATASSKGTPGNRSESYCVVTLTDCRSKLSKPLTDQDLGFYHSAMQNIYTVTGAEAIWDLAKRCHASYSDAMAHNKHFTDMSDLNYLMVKAIQAPQLTPSGSMRTAILTVFDEPLVYNSLDLYQGVPVEDYLACSSIHGVGPSLALFHSIRDGRLSCLCLYPSPLHSRKRMRELVEEMKSVVVAGTAEE